MEEIEDSVVTKFFLFSFLLCGFYHKSQKKKNTLLMNSLGAVDFPNYSLDLRILIK